MNVIHVREGESTVARVITEARRYSEQAVVVLSPWMDDQIRTLAARHNVSFGKAARVAFRVGLPLALELDHEGFMAEHAREDEVARQGHELCAGAWCEHRVGAGHATRS